MSSLLLYSSAECDVDDTADAPKEEDEDDGEDEGEDSLQLSIGDIRLLCINAKGIQRSPVPVRSRFRNRYRGTI